jgi:UDP-glucose 4-epimerase
MQSVAITGISGYIGTRLIAHLSTMDNVHKIVGIDIGKPLFNSPKLQFYSQDILKPFHEIFVENRVDSAINLAFIVKPVHDRAHAERTDIDGNANFLKACKQAKVKHVLYISSHTVYGAHPDNPLWLKEDSPLRPLPDFQYSWDKVRTEEALQGFVASNKSVCVTILRSCPVIGPTGASSAAALMFKPPVMIGVSGYDPPMQFVHEDDLVEVVATFLKQRMPGVFNVAGDGEILYSEVARISGKRMIRLPEPLLRAVLSASWALRIQGDSPTSGLEFIKYPPIVNTKKLKNESSFQFRYSSKEALASFWSTGKCNSKDHSTSIRNRR